VPRRVSRKQVRNMELETGVGAVSVVLHSSRTLFEATLIVGVDEKYLPGR
jgi:hypothetical protein